MDGWTTDKTTLFFSPFTSRTSTKCSFSSVRSEPSGSNRFKLEHASTFSFLMDQCLLSYQYSQQEIPACSHCDGSALESLFCWWSARTRHRTKPFRDQQHTSYFLLTRTFDFQLDGARKHAASFLARQRDSCLKHSEFLQALTTCLCRMMTTGKLIFQCKFIKKFILFFFPYYISPPFLIVYIFPRQYWPHLNT